MSRLRKGCGGSVLLEGVLVLPLYLMALGALFIIGDLARGRMVLLAMERSATWLADDRIEGHDDPGITKMLADFLDGTGFVKWKDGPKGLVNEAVKKNTRIGNRWLNGYMGYMLLPVEVPFWYGMANAEYVADERGERPPDEELPFKDSFMLPSGSDGKGGQYWRSYVVRRCQFPKDPGNPAEMEASAPFDRNAAAEYLACFGRYNILLEPWVEGGADGFHTLYDPVDNGKPVPPYQRLNVLIGFAE